MSCGESYIGQTKTDTAPSSSGTTVGEERPAETSEKNEADAAVDALKLDSLLLESGVSATISILAKKSYVDPDANSQLNRTAMLPGMRQAIGQPDLHPGN